ncbi:hypothetical protein K466DRAFT_311187 [Polyporus arcularius HHB13444]|uniref:Uncharacterized protein n=1 Tax=Polyporus arcularius HHB13444 TaxID=1314778 RepID=A0A5C3NXX5_9APHY|nr:hypothetical protein K466DRAFT_311187 [Polyporus arcularius HHB13444]
MSPQMCSIPGAYPPSPVGAEAPQRQLPSYPPSPAGCYQRHRSDSSRSPLPGYSSTIQNPHYQPFSGTTNPHLCCGSAAATGVGLTIQQPYESSILPPSQCPHSGHISTIIPVYFPPSPPSDTMHISIALQSGCSARNHSATTYGSFLLPLAAAILLLVSLSFGMTTFLSCGASTGSHAPSSSSVHASLIWRALSTLLSYVFRSLGDRDGKL